MKCIVGLGNPEPRYFTTRHNAGRLLVESIAAKKKINFTRNKSCRSWISSLFWNDQEVKLVYPDVYMNQSGEAVKALVESFKLDPKKDLLVLVDEMELSFGRYRLRAEGSDGGHNGMKSIIAELKSSEFPRLRFGINRPGSSEREEVVTEYLLSPFYPEEMKELPEKFKAGEEACGLWITETISKAMTIVNAWK